MALPVSLPCSSGSALATALAAPVPRDDHVQGRGTAAAIALVEVVDQVLVIGEGVHGLNVAVDDPELVVDGFQHRRNGIGGAGCRGDDLVIIGDVPVVDAVDDVLQLTLARCSEQHTGSTVALQVLGETLGVAPAARVVHHKASLIPKAV